MANQLRREQDKIESATLGGDLLSWDRIETEHESVADAILGQHLIDLREFLADAAMTIRSERIPGCADRVCADRANAKALRVLLAKLERAGNERVEAVGAGKGAAA